MNKVAFYTGLVVLLIGLAVWIFRPNHSSGKSTIKTFAGEFNFDTPAFVVMIIGLIVMRSSTGFPEDPQPPKPVPPPRKVTAVVDGNPASAESGGKGCQVNRGTSCARPQHGGQIVPGSGKPRIDYQTDETGTENPAEKPEEYCVTFWANSSDCAKPPKRIGGRASATEEYYESR